MAIGDIPGPADVAFLDGNPKRMLIGDGLVEAASGRTFPTVNPATGEVLAQIAEGGEADIDAAVGAARAAFEGPWSGFKPYERQRVLLRLADLIEEHGAELSLLDTLEMGAPIAATQYMPPAAAKLLRWYSAQSLTLHGDVIENSIPGNFFSYTRKEPVGVVGAIIPWNGPLYGAFWKIGPALATGCTIVLKPAEQASLSALRAAELCLEAGVPEGVVNVVTGFGHVAGAHLAAHHGVDKVAFTGSTETGRAIVRASAGNLKRLSLELGGKSPDIVFADADLEWAVPGAARAIFANSGQNCVAGSRLFVERGIYDEFVEGVARVATSLRVGPGADPQTTTGPLVSQEQLDRVTGYLDAGVAEGARPLAGGARLTDGGLDAGYFVAPTVFTDVRDDMRVAREEIFGPVVTAVPFDDLDEVAARANDTEYGLGAGVWTHNLGRAHELARRIRAGSVFVNCYQATDPSIPFGGYKSSGYGRESGREQMDEYTHVKAVVIRTS